LTKIGDVCNVAEEKTKKGRMIMKKVLVILAILVVAVPAMASVTITATQRAGTKIVDIGYTVTGEPNYMRAIAIDITASDQTITDINNYFVGECNATKQGYGIFPGNIAINAQGVVTSYGTPVAPAADPCALGGLGTQGITVEMGSLYTGSLHPANSGILFSITTADCTTLSFSVNAKRGGVVMENVANPSVTLPTPLVMVCAQAAICKGDFDLDGAVTLDDLAQMVASLDVAAADEYAYVCPEFCPGDFDGDGAVTLDDLAQMVASLDLAAADEYAYVCPE